MPIPIAIPLAISGISALAGLLGNRKKKIEQEQTQNVDVTDMPAYDDRTLYMRNALMDQFMDRVRFNDDFFGGYQNEGMKNINQASDVANRNISQILAAKGLGGSSAGVSSIIQQQLNRLNQQSSFLNSIPMLQDQRQAQNLAAASGFWNNIPTGTRRTGTTTTKGTTIQPGNMLGGALGALGTSLGGLAGMGAFGKLPGQDININYTGGAGTPTGNLAMGNYLQNIYPSVPMGLG